MTTKIPWDYQPTVEDLAEIQEFFLEEQAVAARENRAREISETDTRDETPTLCLFKVEVISEQEER